MHLFLQKRKYAQTTPVTLITWSHENLGDAAAKEALY